MNYYELLDKIRSEQEEADRRVYELQLMLLASKLECSLKQIKERQMFIERIDKIENELRSKHARRK